MDSVNVGLSEIKSASSPRDLGAWSDQCITMNNHVSRVTNFYFHFFNIFDNKLRNGNNNSNIFGS